MNILFVTSLYPHKAAPQYCIFLEQQALALQNQGHTVDILLVQNVHKSPAPPRKVGIRKGLPIYNYRYRTNKWNSLLLLPIRTRELKEFLNQRNYDVISMHFGSLRHFRAIANICKKSKTAVFLHYHGLNVWRDYFLTFKHKLVLPYYFLHKKHLHRAVTALIGVSNLTCQAIQKHHKKSNVHTVYNGVDRFIFNDAKPQTHNTPFRILCVGNLIPIKGQTYLLQAAALVMPQHPVEVWLIGDGSNRQHLEQEALRLGIAEHVKFFGTQPYDQVAAYMAEADMFIMPSFFEAFGCVYVEAMSCGTLTCGCKNNGAAEIIQDGVDGLLVDEKSAQDIADKIVWAIEHPQQAEQIAQNGKEKAKQFSWDASAKALTAVYEHYHKHLGSV